MSAETNTEIFNGKSIKIKQWNKSRVVMNMTFFILLFLSVYGFISFDYKDVSLIEGLTLTVQNFMTMFSEAHFSHFTFTEAFYQVIITLGLAALTTLFGAIIALFFAIFVAQNLTPSPGLSNVIRGVVAYIRAVPTVLWVLIFAVAAGLGSVAAIIGMTFHSAGYLIKAYSESFEELDEGVIEALRGSGAGWWQIIFQAVIPSSVTYLVSWTFLRFEINFGVAIAMGAAAGAGGIGFDMFMASGFYFDLREVGTITYFILLFAILLEIIASRIKLHLNTR